MVQKRHASARLRAACLVLAGLVVIAALVSGCGDGDEPGTEPVVFTESDDGRTVPAAVGDAITIRLSENPSTGYSWTLRQSSGLKLLVDDFEQPTASPEVVGAPGTRVFKLEVTGTGSQVVQAVYHRSWETQDDAGAQEFLLTVEVE
jgi:inhibitor of cysteine peptidase